MSDQIQRHFEKLEDSLTETNKSIQTLTTQITRVVVSNERRDADLARMAHEHDALEKSVENIRSVVIPKIMETVAANKQVIMFASAVLAAFGTGAVGMMYYFVREFIKNNVGM